MTDIRFQIFGGLAKQWAKSISEFFDRRSQKGKEINIEDKTYTSPGQIGNYKWEVFLDAPDSMLSNISKVEYSLDRTFINREFPIIKKEDGFRLKGEAWGEFTIKVEIFMKDGKKDIKYHTVMLSPISLFQ